MTVLYISGVQGNVHCIYGHCGHSPILLPSTSVRKHCLGEGRVPLSGLVNGRSSAVAS